MPLDRIAIAPGIERVSSQTAGEGRWWLGNRVRFKGGWPEKLGGWVLRAGAALDGRVRALLAYRLLNGTALVGIGSNERLYVENAGAVVDITPVDRTAALNNGVATVAGSTLVTVTFSAVHGAAVGDIFTFDTITGVTRVPTPAVVGGVALAGDWRVNTILSTTALTFLAPAPAAATVAAGGGVLTGTFFLGVGEADDVPAVGYGIGPYGAGTWGTPRPASPLGVPARFWSLDAWGEIMLASPSGGRLYSFTVPGGIITDRAVPVVGAPVASGPPLVIGSMIVAMPQRQVLLFGCSGLNTSVGFDPLLVRWSDLEDFTLYLAAADNAAGSLRLPEGSVIRGAFNTQLQTLVWTDTTLYAMRFIGQPLIYRVDVVGRQCGLIGPKAFCELNGAVWWMSSGAFWTFRGGAPQAVPCALWDDVFRDLNVGQQRKVVCGSNSLHGEVWWFYPSALSVEVDRYVVFNTIEGVWYGGGLARTAWHDRGVLSVPIGADPEARRLVDHETGVDAAGAPMGEFLESGMVDIGGGDSLTFVDFLVPDWRRLLGSVEVSFSFRDYPQEGVKTRGPFIMSPGVQRAHPRFRGREMALRLDGAAALGGDWRLGSLRLQAGPDGRR